MKLFFAKKPEIKISPKDGKQVIFYKDYYTNANLPCFTHICKQYSRIRDLSLWKKGLVIKGEDYSAQNGFDIDEVIFNIDKRCKVKQIRFLNDFIDITIDFNRVNCFDVVSFIDVLKTDEKANPIEIIFINDDINLNFNIVF